MHGTINVEQVMRASNRERARLEWVKYRTERSEEHEGLRWYALAETDDERAQVWRLYGEAIERYHQRQVRANNQTLDKQQ